MDIMISGFDTQKEIDPEGMDEILGKSFKVDADAWRRFLFMGYPEETSEVMHTRQILFAAKAVLEDHAPTRASGFLNAVLRRKTMTDEMQDIVRIAKAAKDLAECCLRHGADAVGKNDGLYRDVLDGNLVRLRHAALEDETQSFRPA